MEEIAAGSEHALALTSSGDVWGWGSNNDGQLGMGHTSRPPREPQLITALCGKRTKQVHYSATLLLQIIQYIKTFKFHSNKISVSLLF